MGFNVKNIDFGRKLSQVKYNIEFCSCIDHFCTLSECAKWFYAFLKIRHNA
jgi:hypothetical protein